MKFNDFILQGIGVALINFFFWFKYTYIVLHTLQNQVIFFGHYIFINNYIIQWRKSCIEAKILCKDMRFFFDKYIRIYKIMKNNMPARL